MRTGICTLPQALAVDAASVVKQAVSIARRRGHSQVTPLHIASAMLASSTGLLRRACLQTHSHPLQCKALELCFNVALNRLPASTSSPLLGPHSPHSSLSNALVAAFKRAQANQRRGSIENQQQPILALKIELEQLVVSILDDPSVNRVMREAGFSSTQVKNKVEETVSLDICSQSPQISSQSKESNKPFVHNVSQSLSFNQFGVIPCKPFNNARYDDVSSILSTLVNKRRNIVIVGECLASVESVARGMIDKFERGDVPSELRYFQIISLPLFSLKNFSKDEVEQELEEFRCLVKSCLGRGVVLYIGDLEWVSEYWSSYGEQRRNYYCPVEHIVMELRRLVCGILETGRMCLMGIATYHTYMKCKTGHPSLEKIWELHPLTIPVGSLNLSLNLASESESYFRSQVSKDESKNLTFGTDLSVNFDRSQILASNVHNKDSTITTSKNSNLPLWLQKYKEENRRNTNHDQECVDVSDLYKSTLCNAVNKHLRYPPKTLNFSSSSPTISSTSISSHEQDPNLHPTHQSWPVIFEPKESPKEHPFWISENCDEGYESKLRMFKPEIHEPKPELLSNPNSSPNSASSSEVMEDIDDIPQFTELSAKNLEILCQALENKVPQQKDIIPEIVTSILQCRSRKSERKNMLKYREDKEETWLFFLGDDSESKEKIAREVAKVVFGSQSNFVSICLSSFSLTKADSTDKSRNKRTRDESGCSYIDRFGEAVNENPRRVFFMEDLELVDYHSQKGIKRAIESGEITLPGGETVLLKDAIIIFSCESFSPVSRVCFPQRRQKPDETEEEPNDNDSEEKSQCVSLDLNIAIDNGNENEDSTGDINILESVDKKIIFKC